MLVVGPVRLRAGAAGAFAKRVAARELFADLGFSVFVAVCGFVRCAARSFVGRFGTPYGHPGRLVGLPLGVGSLSIPVLSIGLARGRRRLFQRRFAGGRLHLTCILGVEDACVLLVLLALSGAFARPVQPLEAMFERGTHRGGIVSRAPPEDKASRTPSLGACLRRRVGVI